MPLVLEAELGDPVLEVGPIELRAARRDHPGDVAPLLRDTLALAERSLTSVHASDLVFTDDRAPVESLVDSLVINFLLSGDVDQLRPQG